MKAKIKPITDQQSKQIICSKCSALFPGVTWYEKRGRAIVTRMPKGKPTCLRCLEERLAA